MRRSSTVAMGFVTGLLSGYMSRGLDPSSLLEQVGIMPQALTTSDFRIPLAQYAALFNAVAEDLDDEAVGLFSEPVRGGSFELLVRAVLSSSTLEEALERASRFLKVLVPEMPLRVASSGSNAQLLITSSQKLDRNDPRRIFALEWLLRLVHGMACWLAQKNVYLDVVSFPFSEPAHAADYSMVYTAQAKFCGEELIAEFTKRDLTIPVRRDEGALVDFLVGAPGRISILYRRDRDTIQSVRELLAADLRGSPSLTTVARELKMSPRTLQRRLSQEGMSLRDIKTAIKRNAALAKLTRTDQTVSQIAYEIGYSDAAAFYRAFRNWTSNGPRSYRSTFSSKP